MSAGNMDREAFNKAYEMLNKAQREAVDTVDGPVMVVAGPGTGKTQILTLRIANILVRTDTAPDSILALTFTESGAKAMRERLRRYIGSEAYRVPIFTFHGFAQYLISSNPDNYPNIIGGRAVNDLERISIIEDIVNGGEVKKLRPIGNPSYYIQNIIRTIGQLKQEYVTPDDFSTIISRQEEELAGIEQYHQKGAHKGKVRGEYTNKEKVIDKNRELLYIYRQYKAVMLDKNLYDFDDMIVETVEALSKDEDFLRDLQERYQYILADEHQDVNGSQNKILELLAAFHDNPNIFAVGDEKQAIYRFQGASLENFLYFTEKFPGTKVISLDSNYRSGQGILDAAHSLVEVEEEGPLKDLRIPLKAAALEKSELTHRVFAHQAIEDSWVVSLVQNKLEDGLSPGEIAVIVRTNREVEAISALLRKSGLAVTASADGDILKHPITKAVQSLVDAVLVDGSERALFEVMHGAYWGISTNDLLKIFSLQKYELNLWNIITDKKLLEESSLENISAIDNFVTVIEEARSKEVHQAPHRVLEYLLQASGFLNHLMANDAVEGVRVIRRLYDEIEELVVRDGVGTLKEVSAMFKTRLGYNLPLNAPYISTGDDTVQVMTAHKSKGLEFELVIVPHLTDSGWSGVGKKKYFDIPLTTYLNESKDDFIEDERRLFYVAMTRAKSQLYLSSSETNADGKELLEARLLSDIDEALISEVDTKTENESFNPAESLGQPALSIEFDAAILTSLLKERGFSATSLNNYLRSPWDYFYRNVLRIPEVQATPMQFGTAVHNTLEFVSRRYTKEKKVPADKEVISVFEGELRKLPIGGTEYSRLHEKGLTALMAYVPHLVSSLLFESREEMKLRVHFQTGLEEIPEIVLTGMLDRIDIDEHGKAIRVVDYKTGKPKSRNVIEGKTKDSDGGYKRQLVFYALLLSLYDDDRYRCREGMLSFVEPNDKGVIKEETFIITDQEIEELKQTIIESAREISSGEFLKQACDEKISDYCHLVQLLNRN